MSDKKSHCVIHSKIMERTPEGVIAGYPQWLAIYAERFEVKNKYTGPKWVPCQPEVHRHFASASEAFRWLHERNSNFVKNPPGECQVVAIHHIGFAVHSDHGKLLARALASEAVGVAEDVSGLNPWGNKE